MRRALPLAAFPLVWIACFSSSDNRAGPDAGPVIDASLPDNKAPEAGPDSPAQPPPDALAEASVDASPDVRLDSSAPADASVDAIADAAAPVTVSVIAGTGPEAGVTVTFADASGAVLGTVATDATGSAAWPLPAGGSATVLFGDPSAANLTTALGLQPGQSVVVLDWASVSQTSVKLTALPTTPVLASATQNVWRLGSGYGSCATPPCVSSSASFGLGRFGSTVGAALSTLVEAQDNFGVVYGFAYAKDLPLSPLDDAGALDVALGNTWSTSMTTQTVNVIQPDSGGVNGWYYSEVADGVVIPLMSAPLTTHPGFADFVQVEADFGNSNWPITVQRLAPPTANGTVDLDASGIDAAPTFTDATITLSATGQPTLTWTLSQGTLAGATGLVALTSWSTDGGAQMGTWTFVAPGTAQTSLTGPNLTGPSGFAPLPGATAQVDTLYAITGQTAVPNYGALLGMVSTFSKLHGCVSGPFVPALPATGTAIVSIFAKANGC